MEISKLQKEHGDTQNEVVVLNKAIGQGSIGGVVHVKVKEPESYDEIGVQKLLEISYGIWRNTWSVLGIPDDEAEVM